jgi:hypothetical protein
MEDDHRHRQRPLVEIGRWAVDESMRTWRTLAGLVKPLGDAVVAAVSLWSPVSR